VNEALWALGRGTGIAALVLFSLSVVLGILTRSGRPAAGLPRFGVATVHRNVSLLATGFLGIHIVSLFFDSYAQLKVVDAVFPFLGAYRPFWLGLGTLAFDLLLAVVVTALLRRRIGPRVFRAVHWGAYAMWPIAVVHAVGTGTDATSPVFLGITGACVVAVAVAVIRRLSLRGRTEITPPTTTRRPQEARR
jgi:predicted ferric reductase